VADIPASAAHTLSIQGRRCCGLGAGMSRARGSGGVRRVTYVFCSGVSPGICTGATAESPPRSFAAADCSDVMLLSSGAECPHGGCPSRLDPRADVPNIGRCVRAGRNYTERVKRSRTCVFITAGPITKEVRLFERDVTAEYS
jgi:hypothetical protein